MRIPKSLISALAIMIVSLTVGLAAHPRAARAADYDFAPCGNQAALVASMVKSQWPGLPSLPSAVSLYFELVQRAPLTEPADHRFFYGTHYTRFGDLRLPSGTGPFPVVIVIHGGGWRSRVNLDYMQPLAQALACSGVATWTIEYRRLGADGVYPAMFQDVGAAADYLRELAKQYPLDLDNVISLGHSSGSHLALWLATRRQLPTDSPLYAADPLPLKGVLVLGGTPDIARFMELVPMYHDTLLELVGAGAGATEEQIAARIQEISPSTYAPLDIPQVYITGTQDPYTPLQLVQEYWSQGSQAGDTVRVIALDGAGHFETADPDNTAASAAVWASVLGLLGVQDLPGSTPMTAKAKTLPAAPEVIF